jgi:lysophospholipase L1-like esterase
MRRKKIKNRQMRKILLYALLLVNITSFAQKAPGPFKTGDRVVFAGNSITENGFYELYIWQYYMLHFPGRKITVMNAGIGGDVAGQILARTDDDILAKKPTVVVVTFGMNDSRYFEYWNRHVDSVRAEAVATSYASYLEIEKKLKAATGVQPILMTSSPYDETVTGPKNNFKGKHQTMLEIAKFQEEAAKENNWAFVDLMRPMTAIDEREQKRDTNFTLTGPDRIHPGNAGHFTMAWLFLKAQGLANSVVADVEINAANAKLLKALNCTVSNVTSSANKVSFVYRPNSLPFPSDEQSRVWENPQKQSDALKVIPFTEEFNKEMIRVVGLQEHSQYRLFIDGKNIGEWSGAAFKEGINLALQQNTPQYMQAQEVAELMLQYRELEQKLRSYYWLQYNFFKKKDMYLLDTEAALDSVTMNANRDWGVASKKDNYFEARKNVVRQTWQKMMKDIIDKIYIINQPVKHVVALELVM